MSQATFQYRALDRHGVKTKGKLNARDEREAYRQIKANGLMPIRIVESNRRSRVRGVTQRDLSQLTYQIAVLLEAGIPFVDGLHGIADEETNESLKQILRQVARAVEGGCSITEALEPHRAVFGDVYVETVHAAETSGNLIEVMNSLATMLEREEEMRRNARGALIYPVCVIIVLVLAMGFLMTVIVPRFATMFAGRGMALPLPTQILVWLSDGIKMFWPVMLVGGGLSIVSVRHAWKQPRSRQRIDTMLHRIPYLKDILVGLAISRFAQVFGIALRSGISLIDALELSGRASGRPMLQREVAFLSERVSSGHRLTDMLRQCDYFTPFTRRMLSAGEEAADLTKMCQIIARHYEREVAHLTKNISTLIEPILIIGLAFIVLIVALAIFLPMWNMGALVG
ncbi:MAG: type II secretion system F family protein [Planctomycetota bacterium]|nr:type II secretion system F family protein [Planctomycetota bacterium]